MHEPATDGTASTLWGAVDDDADPPGGPSWPFIYGADRLLGYSGTLPGES